MQCLYCKKKLGLFASRKKQFCSEEHEAAYNEDQASIALKRVLDPMFTERLPRAPLQAGPPPRVSTAGPQSPENVPAQPAAPFMPPSYLQPAATPGRETPPPLSRQAPLTPAPPEDATFRPIVTPPPHASFFPQPRPVPHPSNESAALAPFGFEPLGGETELPKGWGELLLEQDLTAQAEPEDEMPSERAQAGLAQPQETEAASSEIKAAGPPLESHGLHPALAQEKPAAVEPEQIALSLARPQDFPAPILKTLPLSLQILAAETEEVAGTEDVAEPQARVEPEAFAEPETTADARDALEASASYPAPNPVPDSPPNQPAGPGAAGLLWADRLRPEPADEPRKFQGEPLGVVDARLTLRYPSARLPLGSRALGQAGERGAETWQIQTLAAAPAIRESREPAIAGDGASPPGRIPKPPPAAELVRFRLAPARAQFALPDQAGQGGLQNVRWKVFTALREAPAKLMMPQAGSQRHVWPFVAQHYAAQHVVVQAQRYRRIEAHAAKPETAPVVLAGEIGGATGLVAVQLQAAPAEVLAAGAAAKMAMANWTPLEREALSDRRQHYRPSSLVAGFAGFQRARAASYIQVREPELRQAISRGLPWGAAATAWRGVRPGKDELPLRAAVPLRPVVQTPAWAETARNGPTKVLEVRH